MPFFPPLILRTAVPVIELEVSRTAPVGTLIELPSVGLCCVRHVDKSHRRMRLVPVDLPSLWKDDVRYFVMHKQMVEKNGRLKVINPVRLARSEFRIVH